MKNTNLLVLAIGWLSMLLLMAPTVASAKDGGVDFSHEELTQMLAPVALYPDDLLSQVLIASTYPLEVVEADRWVKKNPMLTGANLETALQDKDWDASVKALCEVPTVLAVMSDKLDETTNLGNAFLAQEKQVMDVIQELRTRAYREGNLRSNDKQKVTLKEDGTIVIEPADPQVVYVPYYNTRYVYGSWWYPDWPPWYWGPDEIVVGSGIFFWPVFYPGFSFGFGYWCNFDWDDHAIIFNVNRRPHFFRPDYDWDAHRGGWQHDSHHRRGVVYRDRETAERFGQFPERGRVFGRDVRGFPAGEHHEQLSGEVKRDRDNVGRGPVTASGSTATGNVREGGVERQRLERGNIITSGERAPGRIERGGNTGINRQEERTPARIERAPEVMREPARIERAPEVMREPARIERAPEVMRAPVQTMPRNEPVMRMEPPRARENNSVFGGFGSGREESRSSIRGSESRGSMGGGMVRSAPAGNQFEGRGGGRDNYRR